MPERLPPPPGPSRYSYLAVTAEINRYLAKAERGTKKEMAAATGMDHTAFSHRLAGRYRFTIEQIGAIAEVAGAPTGWPWIKWQDGESFDGIKKLIRDSRPK